MVKIEKEAADEKYKNPKENIGQNPYYKSQQAPSMVIESRRLEELRRFTYKDAQSAMPSFGMSVGVPRSFIKFLMYVSVILLLIGLAGVMIKIIVLFVTLFMLPIDFVVFILEFCLRIISIPLLNIVDKLKKIFCFIFSKKCSQHIGLWEFLGIFISIFCDLMALFVNLIINFLMMLFGL
ncbi:MAG: hypothetical protein MHMPM18_001675 [Marteilia pararefringens]